MSIISYTGLNYNDTVRNKLTIKDKRYISSLTYFRTITMNENNTEIYNLKLKILFKILNKKAKKINQNFRNYKIINFNKLQNCYKKLYFLRDYNDNKYLCSDIVYKIFNSLKLLQK